MKMTPWAKALAVLAVLGFAGCSDSVGPGDVDDDAAMRSLAMGFSSAAPTLPFAFAPSAFGAAARGLDRIDVSIDGSPQSMYALGVRVTYPAGTCLENIYVFAPPVQTFGSDCTAPPLGLLLVLWQTTSGSRPPDRMILISGDVGTSTFTNFALISEPPPTEISLFPAFAFQIKGREEFWTSIGGSLTSQVAATSETCNAPPPPFAKSATCNIATFTEAGQITFERMDMAFFGPPGAPSGSVRSELVIPSQSVRGILQAIIEVQPSPIPLTGNF
jgi:hypothetical protein